MSILRRVRFRWLIFLISLFCILLFAISRYSIKWIYVKSNDKYVLYYDKTNIIINYKAKQIKVLVKFVYKKEFGNNINMNILTYINKYTKLNYTLWLLIFDYGKWSSRYLSVKDYSISGDILDNYDQNYDEWTNIKTNSDGDVILNKILTDYKIQK